MPNDPGALNISYAALAAGEQELGQAFQAAKTAIDDLKAKLNQNLSEWTGDARAAYEQVQREWDQAFAHMATVLQRAQMHLGNTHDMYQHVERQNTSIWGR
jgi:WXG100 family type VII secretion target